MKLSRDGDEEEKSMIKEKAEPCCRPNLKEVAAGR